MFLERIKGANRNVTTGNLSEFLDEPSYNQQEANQSNVTLASPDVVRENHISKRGSREAPNDILFDDIVLIFETVYTYFAYNVFRK